MRHPNEGVLRRLLDEPSGVAVADREHVAGCVHCLGALVAAREDDALIDAALATTVADDVDVPAAWRRLSTATPGKRPASVGQPRARRFALVLRRPAVAVVAFVVVLTGAGTAAASDWLPIFRTENVAPVSISTDALISLPDLSDYGDLAVTGDANVHEVANAAAAADESGLDVPEVTHLPHGVTGTGVYQVGDKVTATFTFSAERAAKAAARSGKPMPPVPAGLDGSSVRLVAGPGVAEVWTSSTGAPALVVGRAMAPTADSSGVPFEVVRDYLLSLPGLPADLAVQLRTFSADGATLPLPVPAGQVTTTSARVNGQPATVLATRDRTLAAAVWVNKGVLTIVAGSLDTGEVLSIANGLQ